ncbi:uncharacterized protein ASCRUDRAFT_72557 [Ascoidea rubescens DSM 1968]|uniref:Uncharacterized protein n=1 Tax=Ascoidea rubescens DSM 1968 TaxID=1344418 RepID=A0A1D2V9N6_9ASCO|nr:hypothetical protein ASCRUDRAFT_72557 [Ascoidea rubescens DSM 1968]ODV58376.1 hypothetical protein ASCRUDRAFT_72557 [Ascoidea rubescens DSM 1968]
MEIIHAIGLASATEDGDLLKERFSIMNDAPKEILELQSLNKNAINCYDTWKDVIVNYFSLMKALNRGVPLLTFQCQNELLDSLSKCAKGSSNWILPTLITVAFELQYMALHVDDDYENNQRNNKYSYHNSNNPFSVRTHPKILKMQRALATLTKVFKVCVNDRELDMSKSKKIGVHFFSALIYKFYLKLDQTHLSGNIEKAIESIKDQLPSIHSIPKSHAINYLYYSGWLKLNDGKFDSANEKLTLALRLTRKNDYHQIKSILFLLIPIKFYTNKLMPSKKVFQLFQVQNEDDKQDYESAEKFKKVLEISKCYFQIFRAIKSGNIKLFDTFIYKITNFLLKKNLYLIFEKIRKFVIFKLFKVSYSIIVKNPTSFEIKNIYQIPIGYFTKAMEFSQYHNEKQFYLNDREAKREKKLQNQKEKEPEIDPEIRFTTDELNNTECLLGNGIVDGYIKGYLSHSLRIIVFSKKQAFINTVKRNTE